MQNSVLSARCKKLEDRQAYTKEKRKAAGHSDQAARPAADHGSTWVTRARGSSEGLWMLHVICWQQETKPSFITSYEMHKRKIKRSKEAYMILKLAAKIVMNQLTQFSN